MVQSVGGFFDDGLFLNDFSFLGFVERAQAFHIGAVDLIERGNPLAAMTVIRSYLENVAAVFWLAKHPEDIAKLNLGAQQGLPIGRVIAEASKHLPGLKGIYQVLSEAAHPAGAGSFHTARVSGEGELHWQSAPAFRSRSDALSTLRWVEELCDISTQIVQQNVKARASNKE